MTMSKITRREILRRSAALGCVGAAGSAFGLQLATMGQAAAQSATTYKALVCIFMFGGNDSHNMVLATDNDSWGRYWSARNQGNTPIALMPAGSAATPPGGTNSATGRVLPNAATAYSFPEAWGGVIPVSTTTANPIPPGTNASVRTFALNPHLAPLVPVWNAQRLAAVANVGPLITPTTKAQYSNRSVALPANLQSHNDQQSTWQSGSAEGARLGWGGLIADQLLSTNGANTVYTAISTAGNAVLLAGRDVVQYQMSTNQSAPAVRVDAAAPNQELFQVRGTDPRVRQIILNTTGPNYFMQDYGAKIARAQDAAELVNAQFAAGGPAANVPAPTTLLNPVTRAVQENPLAVQLETVAKFIAANQALGMKRQVFFVSMGGFDNHSAFNTQHAPLMARLGHALAYFDSVLGNLNGVDMRSSVTTFTASDFNRTFTTNGDGTDHAWGSHHFVMGGAVNGGTVHGQYPTVGVDQGSFQNPNMAGNVLVPQVSVDQYAGTLAKWFGLSDTQIASIFPNIPNFTSRYVGFL